MKPCNPQQKRHFLGDLAKSFDSWWAANPKATHQHALISQVPPRFLALRHINTTRPRRSEAGPSKMSYSATVDVQNYIQSVIYKLTAPHCLWLFDSPMYSNSWYCNLLRSRYPGKPHQMIMNFSPSQGSVKQLLGPDKGTIRSST